MCVDDKICDSVLAREFFDALSVENKVKVEYERDHDLLASDMRDEIVRS
jgi:hypothetical protein